MSYTIPTTVQTKAEAVLAVASAIADEDMGARYDGTVNTSLDVLADVLAAQDVDVPQTNAGAILALAQYAHGGGGSNLGAGVRVAFFSGTTVDNAESVEAMVPFGNDEDNIRANVMPDSDLVVPSGATYWFMTDSVVPSPGSPSDCKAFRVLFGDDGPIGDAVELPVTRKNVSNFSCSVPKLEEVAGAEYSINFVILTNE